MNFETAIQIIHDNYGQDTLVALETIQYELNTDLPLLDPEVIEAYDVAMGGFRNLFAPA